MPAEELFITQESCSNCRGSIGEMEPAYVHGDRIVCAKCYSHVSYPPLSPRIADPAISRAVARIALLAISFFSIITALILGIEQVRFLNQMMAEANPSKPPLAAIVGIRSNTSLTEVFSLFVGVSGWIAVVIRTSWYLIFATLYVLLSRSISKNKIPAIVAALVITCVQFVMALLIAMKSFDLWQHLESAGAREVLGHEVYVSLALVVIIGAAIAILAWHYGSCLLSKSQLQRVNATAPTIPQSPSPGYPIHKRSVFWIATACFGLLFAVSLAIVGTSFFPRSNALKPSASSTTHPEGPPLSPFASMDATQLAIHINDKLMPTQDQFSQKIWQSVYNKIMRGDRATAGAQMRAFSPQCKQKISSDCMAAIEELQAKLNTSDASISDRELGRTFAP